jgi:hypothetical protein
MSKFKDKTNVGSIFKNARILNIYFIFYFHFSMISLISVLKQLNCILLIL